LIDLTATGVAGAEKLNVYSNNNVSLISQPSIPTGTETLDFKVEDNNGDVWKFTSSVQTRFSDGDFELKTLSLITKNGVNKTSSEFVSEFADVTGRSTASHTMEYAPEETQPDTGSFSGLTVVTASAGESVTISSTTNATYDGITLTRVNAGYADNAANFVVDSGVGLYSYDAGGGNYYQLYQNPTGFNWVINTVTTDPSTFTGGSDMSGSGGAVAGSTSNETTLNGYAAPSDANSQVASTSAGASVFDLDAGSGPQLRLLGTSIATTPDIQTGSNSYYFKITDDNGVVWTFRSDSQTKFTNSLELLTLSEFTRDGWTSSSDEFLSGAYIFNDVTDRLAASPQVEYRSV